MDTCPAMTKTEKETRHPTPVKSAEKAIKIQSLPLPCYGELADEL
jgi:hypothetical protein